MPPTEADESPYKPFHPTPVEPKYGRDRGFAVTHLRLDLTVDTKAKSISGKALVRIQPFSALQAFELDAEDLHVTRVTVGGKPATFSSHQKKLLVTPAKRLKESDPIDVVVTYDAKPRRGLYFVEPSRRYPNKPIQAWSQGESEDNHAWFPGYDHPNNKATSEALLTVRDPLTAVSNGHLVGQKKVGRGWTQFHWRMDTPQPNYLTAVVIGRFATIQDTWRKVPLTYLVPVGRATEGKETFRNTPEILEFLSEVTGYPYPYPKYAQAIVADFMWGGMENTTITTVNERFLIHPEHRVDADPDGLIAHEAAHQWFGDLLTTKTWEHLWLNEGFATYFDALFHERKHGKDWFQQEMLDNLAAYLDEDGSRYRRPVVTRNYLEPEDLFDRHTYQKGSLVLHMLRHELGEEAWWKSIRHYVKKFEWRNVETGDLRVAIEEATGRNLEWFFDQWIHQAGYPEYDAAWTYDPRDKFLKLNLKQTQKVAGETHLFRVDLTVRVWHKPDKFTDHKVRAGKAQEAFFLPVAHRPECVQLDPDGWILKKLTFEKDAKEWRFQLEHGTSAVGRVEAAEHLAKKGNDPGTLDALSTALAKDEFWGVRRAAAFALAELLTPEAREAITKGLSDKNPLVRRACAYALGSFRDDKVAAATLMRTFARDRSDYVRASALGALARTHDKGAATQLRRHLKTKSHNDVVASACLAGLGELKDPKAIPVLIASTAEGIPQYLRFSATVALGKLWEFADKKQQEAIRHKFQVLLRDTLHGQRRAALVALRSIPDPELLDRVEDLSRSDPIGLLRNIARETLRLVREKMGSQAQLGQLRKSMDDVRDENKKLRANLNQLEARLEAKGAKRKGKR